MSEKLLVTQVYDVFGEESGKWAFLFIQIF